MENKTSFKKGRKKTGGRKKGTPNKMTLTIREQLKNAIEPFLETMEDTINDIVEPKDKVDAIAKILPFVVPKYQSTTINDDTRRNITLEEYLVEIDDRYKKTQISIAEKKLKVIDFYEDEDENNTT
ncbi:MAG: hypothetical protein IJ698_00180 [Prevotella sp.]|nr:hypothetical protein [Prevotella sp.]